MATSQRLRCWCVLLDAQRAPITHLSPCLAATDGTQLA